MQNSIIWYSIHQKLIVLAIALWLTTKISLALLLLPRQISFKWYTLSDRTTFWTFSLHYITLQTENVFQLISIDIINRGGIKHHIGILAFSWKLTVYAFLCACLRKRPHQGIDLFKNNFVCIPNRVKNAVFVCKIEKSLTLLHCTCH